AGVRGRRRGYGRCAQSRRRRRRLHVRFDGGGSLPGMDGGPHVAGRRGAGDALSVARTQLMFSTTVIVDHVDGADAINAELLKLIEERRAVDEGVVRSNTGGWHSKQDFVNWSG